MPRFLKLLLLTLFAFALWAALASSCRAILPRAYGETDSPVCPPLVSQTVLPGASPEGPTSVGPGSAKADPSLPSDPFQACAVRVLRGDYGRVPEWKLTIYRKALARGLTIAGRCKRTTYCPHCSGNTCADGSRVRPGICAASPNIPMHSWIWVETDGLLKVCDRGGWVKLGGRFTFPSENANFDVWVPRCLGGCWTGPGTQRNISWAMVMQP